MRPLFAASLLLIAATACARAPLAPPRPAALQLSMERDGEARRPLTMCLAADGSFAGASHEDGMTLSVSGRLTAARGAALPTVNLHLEKREGETRQRLDNQLALDAGKTLLGAMLLQVHPQDEASGVEPQQSSLTFYLEPLAACPPAPQP